MKRRITRDKVCMAIAMAAAVMCYVFLWLDIDTGVFASGMLAICLIWGSGKKEDKGRLREEASGQGSPVKST